MQPGTHSAAASRSEDPVRASICILFLIVSSRVFAQTESQPQHLIPAEPVHQPDLAYAVPSRQLLIPAKAVKELQRAQTALLARDVASSARHLEKALGIYPACLEAHNNLGSRYIELGEYEKTASEFERAIEIDPRVMQPVSNLSVALFLLQR